MVNEVRIRSVSSAPDEQIVYTTYHVLALMKLRNYVAAQDELLTLGDLNSPKFRFETHPNFYPSKSGGSHCHLLQIRRGNDSLHSRLQGFQFR